MGVAHLQMQVRKGVVQGHWAEQMIIKRGQAEALGDEQVL